jgi:hypothetical protein
VTADVAVPDSAPDAPERVRPAAGGGWLPTAGQIAAALRLRIADAVGPDPGDGPFVRGEHTSMRQGLGLVVLAGLVTGALYFALLWMRLLELGTVLPLVRAQEWTGWLAARLPWSDGWMQASQQIGGLAPRAPAWLAAGLSAFGTWLHLPLRLLMVWLVYGLLVLALAKLMGAGTTLPRFYAATAYAAPLLLPAVLWPVPWIGPLFATIGVVLALIAYAQAIRAATFLDAGRSILCMLLPLALLGGLYGIFGMLLVALLFV